MAVGGEGFELVVAAVTGWDKAGYVWAGVFRILGTQRVVSLQVQS